MAISSWQFRDCGGSWAAHWFTITFFSPLPVFILPPSHRSRVLAGSYLLKLLVPTSLAGAIIGKGGQVMNDLKASTGVRLKMSRNDALYPSTSDRVCLLIGSRAALRDAAEFIMKKLTAKQNGILECVDYVDGDDSGVTSETSANVSVFFFSFFLLSTLVSWFFFRHVINRCPSWSCLRIVRNLVWWGPGNDRHSNGLMIIDHRCEDGHFHVNMVIRCPRVAWKSQTLTSFPGGKRGLILEYEAEKTLAWTSSISESQWRKPKW